MEFSYTITPNGVRIDQVCEPEAVVVIPERVGGEPVVELGAYALAGSGVEEVELPPSVRRIGAYAFYNCEKLRRLSCGSRAVDLGTGLFAGAQCVERLDMTLFPDERSCLKEMLSELRQTLRVRLREIQTDGGVREARLIFPEYFEESVENTPARILYIETHGCGHRYRYCFVKTQFLYHDYDELFAHVQVQEPEELVTELALGRLLYPCSLSERHAEMYRSYVAEHWRAAGRLLIAADVHGPDGAGNLDAGRLPWLVELLTAWAAEQPGAGAAAPAEYTGAYIALAQQAGDTEMVSWLMDYEHRRSEAAKGQGAPQPQRKRRFVL